MFTISAPPFWKAPIWPRSCRAPTSWCALRVPSASSGCCRPTRPPSNTATPPIRARSIRYCCPCWKKSAAIRRNPSAQHQRPSGGPMKIKDMNWMQVEEYLKRDNRAIIPVGSTEQHGYLSLMVDCILSERMAVDAAEPTGVPVFPTVNYGVTPYFRGFPGSISLRLQTYLKVIEDILGCLFEQGFRNIVIVNGHGGNMPAATLSQEWMIDHPGTRVKF